VSSKRVAAGLIAASLVGSILAQTSAVLAAGTGQSGGVTITERAVARGVIYRRIVDPAGPWVIHELEVDPTESLSFDTVAAGRMGTWAGTSTMAASAGALAGINGDFSVWPGRPMHPFTDDARLKESGVQAGATFGVSSDGVATIRHGAVRTTATDETSGSAIGVATWNTGPPTMNDIAGFTPYGGSVEEPPVRACSARLGPAGKLQPEATGHGFVRDYKVLLRRCRTEPMPVLARTIVLSSKLGGSGSAWIRSLRIGHIVRMHLDNAMDGVSDVIGGTPVLVRRGQVVVEATCDMGLCHKNPRTGVGYSAEGHILMVVVDGRSSESAGMTLARFAEEMRSLGATNALNLDGGGSSTMWIDGSGIVNVPSDTSGERPVTNALVVLPGPKPILAANQAPR
jgi:Phosphodiester glycosidase